MVLESVHCGHHKVDRKRWQRVFLISWANRELRYGKEDSFLSCCHQTHNRKELKGGIDILAGSVRRHSHKGGEDEAGEM